MHILNNSWVIFSRKRELKLELISKCSLLEMTGAQQFIPLQPVAGGCPSGDASCGAQGSHSSFTQTKFLDTM